jgi:hypothetical protein
MKMGTFYIHWACVRLFGTIDVFSGHLVFFSPFWYDVPRKMWQACYKVVHLCYQKHCMLVFTALAFFITRDRR